MLKKVLSISGRSGLFKFVSQGKNMYVAESLTDQKRIPVYPRDKVISLGDIAIYTETEEVPLSTVLSNIYAKQNGTSIQVSSLASPVELRDFFETVLPAFDRERVYPSDIKKVVNWYNILLAAGITDFDSKEDEGEEVQEEKNDDEGETKKDEAPKKKKKEINPESGNAEAKEKPKKVTKNKA